MSEAALLRGVLRPWPRKYHIGNLRAVPVKLPVNAPNTPKLPGRPRRANSFEPKVAAAFGRVVRAERVRQGIAQDEFALIADIDRSNFGRLERGERQPSLGLAVRIAEALGVEASELVRRVEAEMLNARA